MAAHRERRQRGSAKTAVALNAKIAPEAKAKIDRVADALQISQNRAIDLLMEHVDVDAHGRPSWYEGPLPTDAHEELPLQHTA